MNLGLTTWAEMPEPSRSDCHAWGASLNIELLRMVLGVHSDSPGFSRVHIVPALGTMTQVSGSIPHPQGSIDISYDSDRAIIILPNKIEGDFVWKGQTTLLHPGKNIIDLK